MSTLRERIAALVHGPRPTLDEWLDPNGRAGLVRSALEGGRMPVLTTMDEITRLVDAVTDADRSATIHGGTDRARRASDARSALLRAVEGVFVEARAQSFSGHDWNRLLNERDAAVARAESAEAGWKRCAADLASETARANRAEERAEAAIAERDEAMKRASVAKGASEHEARRAESAEAALAEMREALRQIAECGCHVPFRRCPDRGPPPWCPACTAARALASRSPAPTPTKSKEDPTP